MSKAKIISILKDKNDIFEYKLNAIRNKNKYTYKEEEIVVTIIINESNILMYRKLDLESKIEILFCIDSPKAIYHLNNKAFNIDIKVTKLDIKQNQFNIEYVIENEKKYFEFKVIE